MVNPNADSRTLNSVEKKEKQRKEKKKKDKVADILEHPGTQPEIVKRVRKKDKTNVREISVEPGIVSCDPEAREKKKKRKRDREDEEPPSADQNKKRKRKKSSGATSSPTSLVPANDSSLEVADTSGVTGTIATTSEMKTKKNQRKSKSEKPRKKKATGGDAVNISIEAEPAVPPEGQLSRKRKKSKQPAYPDPSDDPDLTEQSQKALTYIYSQSTSPETWKFNKARQNWVIRNVWTPKVPEKYVSMVVEHLSKVQGQARETLIESCKIVVSGSNPEPPGTHAETNEKNSLDNANLSTSKTIVNEKKKWAETLLHALTSKD